MNPLQPQEQSEWTIKYTRLVEGDILELLSQQASAFPEFLMSISHKADYAYAPGKWTIKEMAGHMIDTERVLVYRLTCIARNDKQVLPPFDEDAYVLAANFAGRDLADLCAEFKALRQANMYLFKSLSEEELSRMGTSWQSYLSARTLLYVCAGHVIHHSNVIEERYL